MTILDFIVFVFILGVVSYFAWRSGFEEGQSAANRKHTQQWCRLRNENGILSKRTVDLYDRVDKLEKRLHTAETKIKFVSNSLYGSKVVVKGEMPDDAIDCALVFNHEPSGQVVGKVVETENTEDGVGAKIKMADEYLVSDIVDNAVKSPYEVVAKEE